MFYFVCVCVCVMAWGKRTPRSAGVEDVVHAADGQFVVNKAVMTWYRSSLLSDEEGVNQRIHPNVLLLMFFFFDITSIVYVCMI